MKKIFAFFLIAGTFAACGSNETSNAESGTTAPVTPGIDNVNGNVPDTGETIRLNTPLPTDSATGRTTGNDTAQTLADTTRR